MRMRPQPFKLRIYLLLLYLFTVMEHQPSRAKAMDGFFMYCTSNLDSTGQCVNEEDNRSFSCLIVPGQIITCPTPKTSLSIECVWTSGITANQAQFWCDPEDERAVYGIEESTAAQKRPNKGLQQSSPASADDNDYKPEGNNNLFKYSF
jgi:hypothetical protein